MIFGVLIYFRRGQLQVGATLAYREGKMAARIAVDGGGVDTNSAPQPLRQPDYALNVRIGARTYLLPLQSIGCLDR